MAGKKRKATAYNKCVGKHLKGGHGGKTAMKRAAAACKKHTKKAKSKKRR